MRPVKALDVALINKGHAGTGIFDAVELCALVSSAVRPD
jgi:hypothetical protein